MFAAIVATAAEIFVGVIIHRYLYQPLFASAFYVCSVIGICCGALDEKFRRIVYLELEHGEIALAVT
ncbi:unnamed protein product [Rodentolepis nana]|uniref:PrsW family intramembrane metalloprotease n=1 Tax=Rodentolepis nana TaxID=102285 RepID=A0A0R3TWE7_RODNA|nr:unnamed protein product [Rodentolepis nana]